MLLHFNVITELIIIEPYVYKNETDCVTPMTHPSFFIFFFFAASFEVEEHSSHSNINAKGWQTVCNITFEANHCPGSRRESLSSTM